MPEAVAEKAPTGSQEATTQEQKGQASQTEPPKETKKGSETVSDEKARIEELRANAQEEGRRKALEEVAKAVGVKPSNLDLAQLSEAVQAKKAADDAKKTAEERLAEISTKAEASSAENEQLKSFIAKDAATRFASLSDEAKGFVTEFAGDDPIAQYKFMTSENFQKMTAKAPPRTQGSLQNAGSGQDENAARKHYDALVAKAMDTSLSAAERADHSAAAQRYRKQNSKSF